jgi:hypothetical protein
MPARRTSSKSQRIASRSRTGPKRETRARSDVDRYRPRRAVEATSDLAEADKIMPHLEKLKYPIESPTGLLDQMGGHNVTLTIEGVEVSPRRMLRYVPANYFPITSTENFRSKIAALIREQRDKVDIRREVESLHKQLPRLKYPITGHSQLVSQLGRKRFRFFGRTVVPEIAVYHVPASTFPIKTQQDFHNKIRLLVQAMANRPIIGAD